MYENFSYAQTAIRMGALGPYLEDQFFPEECEQILAGQRKVQADKQRRAGRRGRPGKLRELSRRWMYTGWIFNEKEFEDLCRGD